MREVEEGGCRGVGRSNSWGCLRGPRCQVHSGQNSGGLFLFLFLLADQLLHKGHSLPSLSDRASGSSVLPWRKGGQRAGGAVPLLQRLLSTGMTIGTAE